MSKQAPSRARKKTNWPLELEARYDWATFRKWMADVHPRAYLPPVEECDEQKLEFRRCLALMPSLRNELVRAVRQAPGDRANVIVRAFRHGWWPRRSLVKDLRTAPGGRVKAIFELYKDGLWPKDKALQDIREAPGEGRAKVFYEACKLGLCPQEEAIEKIRNAPRMSTTKAEAMYLARCEGWWPVDSFAQDLETTVRYKAYYQGCAGDNGFLPQADTRSREQSRPARTAQDDDASIWFLIVPLCVIGLVILLIGGC